MLQQSDGGGFMPHGMCYLWEPDLLWLHVVSDAAIGAAYWAIPPTLVFLVLRARRLVPEGAEYEEKRLPHEWMLLMFGLFIVACGTTHLLAAWNVWNADYWLSGGVKALTATVSVATAVALPPLVPRALQLVADARTSELREEQLEEANRELASLNRQLQQVHAQQTRFFANISHELRTPLTLILGPVEQRLSETDDPGLREDLELVRSNGRLLERRVDDLLDLARTESGEHSPRYYEVDLRAMADATAMRFRHAASERDVEVRVEGPDTLVVETDGTKVERVMDNLVTNAFKFAPAGGQVVIRLGREGESADDPAEARGHVVLEVGDSGPGLPEEERERVFERFQQLGTSGAAGTAGSGLGLAIVRDFVQLLGGTIGVDEDPDLGGARFRARLPARAVGRDTAPTDPGPEWTVMGERAAVASPVDQAVLGISGTTSYDAPPTVRSDEADRAGTDGPSNVSAPSRVLVVEDVPNMRAFLERTLRQRHEVRVAGNGEDALSLLDDWRPDLILTDLMMPGMDGATLVHQVRARKGLGEVPILVLSARADDAMRTQLLRGGAQDYVTKPFSAEELLARVGNLVSMKRVRDLLRSELESASGDVQDLALEVKERHAELEKALLEVRAARDEAESASRAKSEFLAVMSHELRTPLNAIIGYAQLMRDGVASRVGSGQIEHLDRIRSSAEQLVGVIDDILLFSREGASPRPVAREEVDVPELLGEVVEGVVPAARRKGVRLEREVEPELRLASDRERLRRILTNLVSNAVKFTAEGSVTVTAAETREAVVFRVRDTGPGIGPADREQVFEPFWQVDQSSTRKQGGTGLGLSIVKRLVDQLGGTIELTSELGTGSTFTVRVPRHAVPEETETEGQREIT